MSFKSPRSVEKTPLLKKGVKLPDFVDPKQTITTEMFHLMQNSKIQQIKEQREEERFNKKIMNRMNASKRKLRRLRHRNLMEKEIKNNCDEVLRFVNLKRENEDLPGSPTGQLVQRDESDGEKEPKFVVKKMQKSHRSAVLSSLQSPKNIKDSLETLIDDMQKVTSDVKVQTSRIDHHLDNLHCYDNIKKYYEDDWNKNQEVVLESKAKKKRFLMNMKEEFGSLKPQLSNRR